jgi:hypothetical protein
VRGQGQAPPAGSFLRLTEEIVHGSPDRLGGAARVLPAILR